MGFLRRVFGGGDEGSVPDWASFFTPAEYRAFLDAVTADLRRRGLSVELGDGVAYVPSPDGGEPQQFGLSNLAQMCHADEQDAWSRIIATHFTSLLAMQGRDLDALAADYDQVVPILRVRLMPDETMGGVALPASVIRPIAPGILAVLVFDFPDSTASVHQDHLAVLERQGFWVLPAPQAHVLGRVHHQRAADPERAGGAFLGARRPDADEGRQQTQGRDFGAHTPFNPLFLRTAPRSTPGTNPNPPL